MYKYTSGRTKKTPRTGLTSDRYEFLGLEQAEPDLGDPLIGPSSVGANPYPAGGTQYVLVAYSNKTGKRYWVPGANITGTGLIPGSFTVFNNDVQVGLANSFNKFNFVGTGVTVDPVGVLVEEQTGIATIRISVVDVNGPGNLYSIPYKASTGLLAGASNFVYDPTSQNVGLGTTIPTATLEIVGNVKVSGIITAPTFSGTATTATNLANAANITTGTISSSRLTGTYGIDITGTATTATNLSDAANITTGTISSTRLSGTYGIDITGTATTSTNLSNAANITTGTISSSRLSGTYGISISGTATTSTNLSNAANITTGTISSSRLSGTYGISISGTATTATNLANAANITTGTISSSRLSGTYGIDITGTATTATNSTTATNVIGGIASASVLSVVGISTFTNGPVLIGVTSVTGTSSQPLQIIGGAYVSGNLGVANTNPVAPLQVETYTVKTGLGTFIASVGVSTTIDSFSVSSTNFKTAEYTIHVGFGSYIQSQKVLVMQDQSSAYSEEYGVMYNNSLIVSVGATISGENCIIQATPKTGITGLTTFRFVREGLL